MSILITSKSRENILSKIRKGLGEEPLPLPFPEAEKESLKIYGNISVDVIELFAENFIKLGGKFVFCEDERELLENLVYLHENRNWETVLCAHQPTLDYFTKSNVQLLTPADVPVESADACITECELLLARTGSIMVSSALPMGRTSSIYYPAHICIAYINQVAGDMDEAIYFLKKKYGNNLPSMISLQTGPSRTADIEKTLVVGVHGPEEVFCFIVNKANYE